MSDKIVKSITGRVSGNINKLSEKQSKQILNDLIEALIVLFVSEEPKLADPSLNADEKAMPFFKAITKLAAQGGEAYMLQRFMPSKMKAFEDKIAKFKNLETHLTLLTQ